ncbi:hypothetical protein SLA2020_350550 [Shorea laevis]
MCFFNPLQRRLYLSAMEKSCANGGHGVMELEVAKERGRSAYQLGVTSVLGAETGSEKVDQVHAKTESRACYWLKTRVVMGERKPLFRGSKADQKMGVEAGPLSSIHSYYGLGMESYELIEKLR